MKSDILSKIENDVSSCELFQKLPNKLFIFAKEIILKEAGDCYEICSYRNNELKKGIYLYFHEETKEYKLRVRIGLTEFCIMEFITNDIRKFEDIIQNRLNNLLEDMAKFNAEHVSILVKNTGVLSWDYSKILPEKIEGFNLFIEPSQPVKIINGSYIIVNYVNFETESDFIIYYNIFRDEFFGEIRHRRIPEIKYEFDSKSLIELEEKISNYLIPILKNLNSR